MLVYLLTLVDNDADRAFVASLYSQYYALAQHTAQEILKNHKAHIEDAVQNAFVKIIRNLEKIRKVPCGDLAFYIVSIVKNESISILRRQNRFQKIEDWQVVEEDVVPTASNYDAIIDCFAKLPENYCVVLEMKFLLGYKEKEIARKLGLSLSAASMRISRGKKLLREILEQEGFTYATDN